MPIMKYETDPYDLGYFHGFTEEDNQNPYIENSPEWNEYKDGFYQVFKIFNQVKNYVKNHSKV